MSTTKTMPNLLRIAKRAKGDVRQITLEMGREFRRQYLIAVLNGEPGIGKGMRHPFSPEVQERVVSQTRVLIELSRMIKIAHQDGLTTDFFDALKMFAPGLQRLNQTFSECQMHPFVEPSPDGRSLVVRETLGNGNAHDVEATALLGLVDLVRGNAIGKLTQCSCGTWFIAKVQNPKACTKLCYLRNYQSTEEYKAYRRKYYHDELKGGWRVGKKFASKKQIRRKGTVSGNAKASKS